MVVTTSASHLRRAVAEFERVGIQVIPAAVDIVGRSDVDFDSLIPTSAALGRSNVAFHEILGRLKP